MPYENNPTQAAEREYVSRIELVRQVRPGALTIRVEVQPPRGWGSYSTAPRDRAPIKAAPEFVEALTKALLGVRTSPS